MSSRKLSSKKAQAAMEFLMTYGWAILVVLVVISALAYFGVVNPTMFLPEKCFIGTGLSCEQQVLGENEVHFSVRNNLGNKVTITAFKVLNGDSTVACEYGGADIVITPGQSSTIKPICTNVKGSLGSKEKFSLDVKYYEGSSAEFQHSLQGELLTTIEEGIVTVPENLGNIIVNDDRNLQESIIYSWDMEQIFNTIGDPQIVPGKVGNAVAFDGDDAINLGSLNDAYFEKDDSFSIGAWVNVDTWAAYKRIFEKDWDNNQRGVFFGLDNNQNLAFIYNDFNGNPYTDINQNIGAFGSTTSNLNDNSWHHVLAVYDNQNVKLYVDGIYQENTIPLGGFVGAQGSTLGGRSPNIEFVQNRIDYINTLKVDNWDYYVNYYGSEEAANEVFDNIIQNLQDMIDNPAYDQFFTGKIDEVIVWDKALTQTEITALVNSYSS